MEIKEQIAQDIKENSVIVYMKGTPTMPQCGFSARVISILESLNVSYTTRDVLSDPELRQGIKDFSEWPTIPQLYINEEFIGGCDIITEQYESGELDDVLKG